MGLRRCEAAEFYAATSKNARILAEKRGILDLESARYSLISSAGSEAAREFAEFLGLSISHEPDFDRSLSLAIEPDLLFVLPPAWTLTWASVCFPTRWTLEGKLHEPLAGIHAAVPELNEQLGRKISLFFDRLIPGEGWRRANWGLTASAQGNQHPSLSIPSLGPDTPTEQTYIRIEDQHLLKLPRSGAIAFGIRIVNFRLGEALAIPGIRAGLEQKLRTMPTKIANYKGLTQIAEVTVDKL